MYNSEEIRYKRTDGDEEAGGWGLTIWGWLGISFGTLLLLAILGVAAATLGIVDDHKNSWKGIGALDSSEDEAIESALHRLEKHLGGLDDKVDWVKKDLGDLDDIQKELWWIHEKLSKDYHSKSRSHYSRPSFSESYSEDESDSTSGRKKSDKDRKDRKDKDCCPVRKGEQLLFCDPYDGTQGIFDPSTGCPYFYFADPTLPFIADDGAIAQDFKKGFIKVDSLPYTSTVPQGPLGGVDHVKFLTYQTLPKSANEWQTLRYDIKMACETDTGHQPFPPDLVTDPDKDIRLASCAANSIDFETLLVADWFFTGPRDGGKGVKGCFYERLPFLQNCTDPSSSQCYRAFSSFNITGTRTKNDKEYVSIEYDREAGEIRWYDKGKLVCKTGDLGTPNPGFVLGLDHGGNNQIIDPKQFSYGFGDFTLLDMTNFLDPSSETGLVKLSNLPGFYVHPCDTCFFDTQSLEQNRLFGQGAKFMVWQSTVTVH